VPVNYWAKKAGAALDRLLLQPEGIPCRVQTTRTQADRLKSKIYVGARERNMHVLVEKEHGYREISLIVFRIFGLAARGKPE